MQVRLVSNQLYFYGALGFESYKRMYKYSVKGTWIISYFMLNLAREMSKLVCMHCIKISVHQNTWQLSCHLFRCQPTLIFLQKQFEANILQVIDIKYFYLLLLQ